MSYSSQSYYSNGFHLQARAKNRNGVDVHVGVYDTAEEAAWARDVELFKHRGWNGAGKHAPYNFPERLKQMDAAKKAAITSDDQGGGEGENDMLSDIDGEGDDEEGEEMEEGEDLTGSEKQVIRQPTDNTRASVKRSASGSLGAGTEAKQAPASSSAAMSPSAGAQTRPRREYLGVTTMAPTASGEPRFRVSRCYSIVGFRCGVFSKCPILTHIS